VKEIAYLKEHFAFNDLDKVVTAVLLHRVLFAGISP